MIPLPPSPLKNSTMSNAGTAQRCLAKSLPDVEKEVAWAAAELDTGKMSEMERRRFHAW